MMLWGMAACYAKGNVLKLISFVGGDSSRCPYTGHTRTVPMEPSPFNC